MVSDALIPENKIKPASKEFEYIKLTESMDDIAKMMIDGDVFYNRTGRYTYSWAGGEFVTSFGGTISVDGVFYRRVKALIKQEKNNEIFNASVCCGYVV